jgi:hypothetical protein
MRFKEIKREAADPTTRPARLAAIALQHHKRTVLLELVGQNPNTPKSELLELLAKVPTAVLENPVFPLLLLEDPTLFERLAPSTFAYLVRRTSKNPQLFTRVFGVEKHRLFFQKLRTWYRDEMGVSTGRFIPHILIVREKLILSAYCEPRLEPAKQRTVVDTKWSFYPSWATMVKYQESFKRLSLEDMIAVADP